MDALMTRVAHHPRKIDQFRIPNPYTQSTYLSTELLQLRVIDSPVTLTESTKVLVAVLIVPKGREQEWIYGTDVGNLRLIYSLENASRLILLSNVGNSSPIYKKADMEASHLLPTRAVLIPILRPLCLGAEPVWVTYQVEDNLLYASPVYGGVGSYRVEDVQLETGDGTIDIRRRLRFKEMPDRIQSECRVNFFMKSNQAPVNLSLEALKLLPPNKVGYTLDTRHLVSPALQAMACGLFVIGSRLDEKNKRGETPVVLCFRTGGAVFEQYLRYHLGLVVHTLERDGTILLIEPICFEFEENDITRLENKVMTILNQSSSSTRASRLKDKYDVIILDITCAEVDTRVGACGPPREFVDLEVMKKIKSLLCDSGAVIINVTAPDFLFHAELMRKFKTRFHHVYRINLGTESEFILIGTDAPSFPGSENFLHEKINFPKTNPINEI